ncbi:MAG: dihydropteroate synthase [Lachnospiraceae bacterium]|nr:dihydropteroate synthase [Lachnospiraceae bacterium]
MKIGKKEFDLVHETYIMGILNVTPDSFSDGGSYNDMDKALFHAEQMIKDGAAILDIGGESTRPGHIKISEEEEISRVCPILESLKKNFDIPLSLDTYKSKVAQAGILAGADLINDIWGLKWDDKMAGVVAKAQIPVCLMHNRKEEGYADFIKDVKKDLLESISIAKKAGILEENIILDPGIGFAKIQEQNLQLMNHLEELKELGYPVLLGTSRKRMIGFALGLEVEEREEGTMATTVMGVMKGASIFRVHHVLGNYRAMKMTQAILQSDEKNCKS